MRIGDGLPSNSKRIAVDIPRCVEALELTGLCDSQTWIGNQLDLRKGHSITLWVAGLPGNDAPPGLMRIGVSIGGARAEAGLLILPASVE